MYILKTFAPDPPAHVDPFTGLPNPGEPAYEALRRRNAALRETLRAEGRCEWCAEAECRCDQPSDDAESWADDPGYDAEAHLVSYEVLDTVTAEEMRHE